MKKDRFSSKSSKTEHNNGYGRPNFNAEKILFLAFIIVFVLLIMVQAALTSPSLRTFLVTDSKYQGSQLGSEETLYETGRIGLELTKGTCSPDIKVLVNGEEEASFAESHIDLTVKNGDVIEIDDSSLKEDAEVTIASISKNIDPSGLIRVIGISKGIKRIAVIRLENEDD